MARFLSVGICAFACFSGIICEPHCSPFHYHEQLLERMIDVKYKMDALSEKMEKWESIVSEKLEKMDELQRTGSQLKTRLEEEFRDQATYLNATIEEFTEYFENRKRNDNLNVLNVLFKARDVKKRSSLTVRETVIFQTIVQNEGQGYNNVTGFFTAPINGTYLFTAQFCLYASRELRINIVANGINITAAKFGDKAWSGICTSTEGFAMLRQGNRVEVQVASIYSDNVIHTDSLSYFSGVLLHT